MSYEKYINQKYGRLKILEVVKNEKGVPYAKCKCDCGNTKDIMLRNITTNKSKSCGCWERESRYIRKHANTSIIGQRFGRLTVIKDSGKRNSGGSVLWECQCDCGNITYSCSSNLKRGHTTSCGCAKQEFLDSCLTKMTGNRYGFLTVLNEFKNDDGINLIECKCDCGNTIIINRRDVLAGHTVSCGCWHKSHGEVLIEDYLKNNSIKYESQKRFDDCRNKKKLPFDFYLPEYNLCIEYQGEQHFKLVNHFGGEEGFKRRQENDKIKKQYCEDKNIHLLYLLYNLTDEEIITTLDKYFESVTSKFCA